MGCDIHLYVERRTDAGWEQVPNPGDDRRDPRNWYNDRNYYLFAILADVRNGYGFAGHKTSEGFHPISAPRGLPADVSDPVKVESASWEFDGHSHSYLTISEVLAFDWDQEAILMGESESRSYFQCGSDAWWGTIARAARLSKGSLDDVRFVFWFDN